MANPAATLCGVTQSGEESRRVGNKKRANDWAATIISPDALPRRRGKIQPKLDQSRSVEKNRRAAAENWASQNRYLQSQAALNHCVSSAGKAAPLFTISNRKSKLKLLLLRC